MGATTGHRRAGADYYAPGAGLKTLWLKALRADAAVLLRGPLAARPAECRAAQPGAAMGVLPVRLAQAESLYRQSLATRRRLPWRDRCTACRLLILRTWWTWPWVPVRWISSCRPFLDVTAPSGRQVMSPWSLERVRAAPTAVRLVDSGAVTTLPLALPLLGAGLLALAGLAGRLRRG